MSVLTGFTWLNADAVLTVIACALLLAVMALPVSAAGATGGCSSTTTMPLGTGGGTALVSWFLGRPLALAGALAVIIAIIVGLFSPGDLGNHVKNALITLLVVFLAGTLVGMVIAAANNGSASVCSQFAS